MSANSLSPRSRLAQLVFDLRLIAIGLTVIGLSVRGGPSPPISVWFALGLALAASYLGLRHADAAEDLVQRLPAVLPLDLALGIVLLAVAGSGSPFVYYTVGSVLLAGLLRGARAAWLSAVTLLGIYFLLLATRTGFEVAARDFQGFVGIPALYVLSAAGSVAVRQLIERQRVDSDRISRLSVQEAAAAERVMVAREIHDSLTGDLSGIALSAAALPEIIPRDPTRASERAVVLADAAAQTASNAREVIRALRGGPSDLPLDRALKILLEEWSAHTGIRAVVARADSVALPAQARHEALAVCKEALENVVRHAGPCSVTLEIVRQNGEATMTIADNGAGFAGAVDTSKLSRDGHYGLVGMHERASRVGGTVFVKSAPGTGTRVRFTVPATNGSNLAGAERHQ